MVDFRKIDTTKKDMKLIEKIATRTIELYTRCTQDSIAIQMNLCVVHHNQPLRLKELLEADAFNFLHDVVGISVNLSKKTGKLGNNFLPRFTV